MLYNDRFISRFMKSMKQVELLLLSLWWHVFIGKIMIQHDFKNGMQPDLDNCRTKNVGTPLILEEGDVFGFNSIRSEIMKLLHMFMNDKKSDTKTGTWKMIFRSNII